MEGTADQIDRPAIGVMNGDAQAADSGLRMSKDSRIVPHRSVRQVDIAQAYPPFFRATLFHDFLKERNQDVPILHAQLVRCKAGVGAQIRTAGFSAESLPLSVVAYREDYPVVFSAEELVEHYLQVSISLTGRHL